jgi:pyrimidine-nucleoside phosphorylase
VRLAGRMLELAGRADGDGDAERQVRSALTSGAALDKFAEMIARQGGDARIVSEPARLPQAKARQAVVARAAGYLARLDAELVGRASMLLGAGRETVTDTIDFATGAVVVRKPGDAVGAGDPILVLHHNDDRRLAEAVRLAESAIAVLPEPPASAPLVLDHVR